jgi:hypothetical protein
MHIIIYEVDIERENGVYWMLWNLIMYYCTMYLFLWEHCSNRKGIEKDLFS